MSSSDQSISVRELGKSYVLGQSSAHLMDFRKTIVQRLRYPLRHGRQDQDTFWALRDVALEVQRGEVVGLIGRNGAGKSTLLKILSRITHPTTGAVDIYGRVASLLEVGTGFHPELTGRENIFLNGCILGMTRREVGRRFDEIVAFAEVEKFLDTPVKRYSSGMYVRLAFAVAAHLEPEILIVDEVLAVGDSSFQQKCLGKMKSAMRSGERTILFVSHNLSSIRSLCSRVVWLKAGRVAWDGDVGAAIEGYLTEDLGGTSNTFDIGQAERSYVIETPVRLLRVTFNDGRPIRHGEPLRVDIDYEAERRTEGVVIGVNFCNIEGVRIMAVDSDIPSGCRFDLNSGSAGRVTILVTEFHLQPGRYLLDIAAASGENVALDVVKSFAQIEVVPGDRTPGAA